MFSLRPRNLAFLSTLLVVPLLVTAGCRGGGPQSASVFPEQPLAAPEDSNESAPLEAPAAVSPSSAAPAAPVAEAVEAPPSAASVDAAPAAAMPAPAAWAPPPRFIEGAWGPPSINARAAVIVDEASGAVLYDKDAHLPLPPASLTKVATLILALESGRLDDWVQVDVDHRLMRGSSVMGLLPGDCFTLRDLLYGLMLPSGNDAALAIGRHLAGSDEAFVAAMNHLLQRLGLRESHFLNPHGLSREGHFASAYDLAMLTRYGMTLPGFHEIVSARRWVAEGSRRLVLENVNTFLDYPGADGVKTGYTRSAGRTLIASAWRDGRRVYAVVLNSQTRDEDAMRLLDWAFTSFRYS